jgi:endonuclease III
MAGADIADLEALVRSTGFFHAKAKGIRGAAEALDRRFPSGFPSRMNDLLTLPGVGRKTANVVLGTCFGAPAIIVDTHVRRVSQRLGLASSEDPDEIERELQALLPEDGWTAFSHRLTFHGRRRCHARKPDCRSCLVAGLCPSRQA